jgi:hypothetical protein
MEAEAPLALWPGLGRRSRINGYGQQDCGEVIAKSRQSGTSPERSSCSIVVLVSAEGSGLPIQLSETQICLWWTTLGLDLHRKNGLWWNGVFLGDI